ncbi:MAG: hypothetical protein H0V96_09505 [Acidimicrobiia bacterium]|nr:hypothetical protein [Acidimicrobiia bacterium]
MAATYAITVPGSADYLLTLRIFVGGVARQMGLDEDRITDLKMAVSEGATMALLDAVDSLQLSVEGGDGWVTVRMPMAGDRVDKNPEPLDVVRALLDGNVEIGDEQVVLRVEIGQVHAGG